MALWVEGSEKGQWPAFLSGRRLSPSSHLDNRHFTFSLFAIGAFQLLPECWSSGGVNLIKSLYGFFKRNCLGLQKFLPLNQSPLVFAARSYRDFSSWHWNPGWGAWSGAGTPCSWDIPPEFLSTTCGCGTSPFCISTQPTSLDGCSFLDVVTTISVVVRLPFNSISDSSEWWLIYISVVILMWLFEEANRVCLCHCLDWKSNTSQFQIWIWLSLPFLWW